MMFNHRYSVWNADEDELYETDKAVVLHAWAETGHTAARITDLENLDGYRLVAKKNLTPITIGVHEGDGSKDMIHLGPNYYMLDGKYANKTLLSLLRDKNVDYLKHLLKLGFGLSKELIAVIERRNLVIPYTNNFKGEIMPGANESVSIPTMVLDTYKDSADAKLVAKHFGPSLCEGPFGKVLLAAMREPVLAEAKRLEEEANKK
jgi:hypothetical protein